MRWSIRYKALAGALMAVICLQTAYAQPIAEAEYYTVSAWAKNDVKEACELNIVQPYMMNNYQKPITREEFCDLCVSVISKWNNCEFIEVENLDKFSNIPDCEGFADTDIWFVKFCARLGIVSGKGNGVFAPDDPITRQEAAKMLYNTLKAGLPEIDNSAITVPHVFKDGAKIQSWAREDINAVYHMGVMMGDTENRFSPNDTYTREQAYCTFLRLYNLKNKENINVNPEFYPSGKYGGSIKSNPDGSYYLNMPYQNMAEYEPEYIDTLGNCYTAKDKGYVYPIDASYMEVLTSIGVGVHGEAIINKNKEEIVSAESIEKIFDDYAGVFDYGGKIYNLKTGQEITVDGENADIYGIGCGMYSAYSQDRGVCYLNSSFERVTSWGYKPTSGKFYNNMLAVVKPNGEVQAIDTAGKIIQARKIDLNRYMVYDIYGTNIILQNNATGEVDILRVVSGEYVKGFEYAEFMPNGEINVVKSREEFVLDMSGKVKFSHKEKGYSDIYRSNSCDIFYLGSKTSDTPPYNPVPYDLLDTNGNFLLSGLMENYLITDGGGVYCAKRNNYELVIFDSKGVELGNIKTDSTIYEVDFINGLLRVGTNDTHTYYLQNGEKADFINKILD